MIIVVNKPHIWLKKFLPKLWGALGRERSATEKKFLRIYYQWVMRNRWYKNFENRRRGGLPDLFHIFKTFLGNLHYFMKISNLFLHFPRFEPYQFWLSTSHHLSTHFDRPNRPRILREVFHQNECWLHYVVCPHLDRTRCWN